MRRACLQCGIDDDGLSRIDRYRHGIQAKAPRTWRLAGGEQDFVRIDCHGGVTHAVGHALLGSGALDGNHAGIHHKADALSLEDLNQSLCQRRFRLDADRAAALQHGHTCAEPGIELTQLQSYGTGANHHDR